MSCGNGKRQSTNQISHSFIILNQKRYTFFKLVYLHKMEEDLVSFENENTSCTKSLSLSINRRSLFSTDWGTDFQ